MLNLLRTMFGNADAVTNVVEKVSNGLDSLVHTEQEKSEAAAKERAEARGMLVEWMRATQGQNLARRFIAIVITGLYALLFILSYLAAAAAVFVDAATAEKLIKLAELTNSSITELTNSFMLVLGFYFAAPHMTAIVNRFSNGYTKRSE